MTHYFYLSSNIDSSGLCRMFLKKLKPEAVGGSWILEIFDYELTPKMAYLEK